MTESGGEINFPDAEAFARDQVYEQPTSREKLRSMFDELAGSPTEYGAGDTKTLRYDIPVERGAYSDPLRKRHRRKLEAISYGIAAGLDITPLQEGAFIVSPDIAKAFLLPSKPVRGKDSSTFDEMVKNIVEAEEDNRGSSIELSVEGNIKVRGYDLTGISVGQKDVLADTAQRAGWQIRINSQDMLVLRGKMSRPTSQRKSPQPA